MSETAVQEQNQEQVGSTKNPVASLPESTSLDRDASSSAAWSYSTNGEYYDGSFASREEALAEGSALALEDAKPGATTVRVWTGVQVPFVPRVTADNIFDQLAAEASDFAGDAAEDWLFRVPKEDEKALSEALTAAFTAWMTARGHAPTFYGIADEMTHDIPVTAEVPA